MRFSFPSLIMLTTGVQIRLNLAVCSTIGAFSKWIDAAPAELPILPPLVDILNKGMSTSEDTAAAASVAFKYICEGTTSLSTSF